MSESKVWVIALCGIQVGAKDEVESNSWTGFWTKTDENDELDFEIIHQLLKNLESDLNFTLWLKTRSVMDSIKIFMRDRFCNVFLLESVQLYGCIWCAWRGQASAEGTTAWGQCAASWSLWLQKVFLRKRRICNVSPLILTSLCRPGITSQAHFAFCLCSQLKQQMYL